MQNILVTGGTVFVSRMIAEYFVSKGNHVYVLNRNTHAQSDGVTLIEADRHHLGDALKQYHFDTVIDVTAYNAIDVNDLLDSLNSYDQYILISSSAVYPETGSQPFQEDSPLSLNHYWGKYGTDKIESEQALLKREKNAYILRPPYLYGPMNNVYREAFIFDCAIQDRTFYLPKNGEMKLQFFHITDLCHFIDIIMKQNPSEHIFNVGNTESISTLDWIKLCYKTVGKELHLHHVYEDAEQRNYFPFYNYEYCLDVKRQMQYLPKTISIEEGLRESYAWYQKNLSSVTKKPFFEYIDKHFND